MSTTSRRIAVLLPPEDREGADELLAAAAALAQSAGARLDVLALRRSDQRPAAPLPPAIAGTWWDITHPRFTHDDSDTVVAMFEQAVAAVDLAAAQSRLLLLPQGALGEEVAARLAHRMRGVSLGRCSQLGIADDGKVHGVRAAYGGRVEMTLASDAPTCVATWRPAAARAATGSTAALAQRRIVLDGPLPEVPRATLAERADSMPALEGARLVVSGGRGIGGEEGFDLLARIASRLGAALGGSLPTVDAGWVPVARQIGQSGKFVTPQVYFAVGISGTPQHMAGVSEDARIIAVNKDPEAPIFQLAEVGVVAQWEALLPRLLERLDAAKRG